MTKHEALQQYNDFLDELYPLDEINCNSFSTLLEAGDVIAYDVGFYDYCDSGGIEFDD